MYQSWSALLIVFGTERRSQARTRVETGGREMKRDRRHNAEALYCCYVHAWEENGIWTSTSHRRLRSSSVLSLFLFSSSLSRYDRQDNHDQPVSLTRRAALSFIRAIETAHQSIYTRYHRPPTNIPIPCKICTVSASRSTKHGPRSQDGSSAISWSRTRYRSTPRIDRRRESGARGGRVCRL